MKFHKLLAIVAATVLASGASAATISTSSAGGEVIATPAFIQEDNPTNTLIQAFNEGSNVFLTSDLAVDNDGTNGGIIAGGQYVDSHMIFLNTASGSLSKSATFTFSQAILGVMSSQNGSNMFASDVLLGGGVDYSVVNGNYNDLRGLESNDSYSISADLFSINVNMSVAEPGDWMRVVTIAAVPVPAALPLLLAGLGAFGFIGRRKRKAA